MKKSRILTGNPLLNKPATMANRPAGSVYSGELAHKLWVEGETNCYAYTKGKRSFRIKIFCTPEIFLEKHRYHCTDINGSNRREFDFNGLLHVMNDPKWESVVFTDFWFAWAYEQSLKQRDKS